MRVVIIPFYPEFKFGKVSPGYGLYNSSDFKEVLIRIENLAEN